MQNAAFQAAGLDWSYELLDVPANGLAGAMATVRSKDSAARTSPFHTNRQ